MSENITADSMFISNGIHIEATQKNDFRIMCNWCTVTDVVFMETMLVGNVDWIGTATKHLVEFHPNRELITT